MLSLVGLRGLIPVPHLLHLLVLHWCVWGVSLRGSVGVVTKLSTLEASSGCGLGGATDLTGVPNGALY
jgi:hypothetical protein